MDLVSETPSPGTRGQLSIALWQLQHEARHTMPEMLSDMGEDQFDQGAIDFIQEIRRIATEETRMPIEYATDRDIAIVVDIVGSNMSSMFSDISYFMQNFLGGSILLNSEEGAKEVVEFIQVNHNLLLLEAFVKHFLEKFAK